jgi:uncharacterized protein YacL
MNLILNIIIGALIAYIVKVILEMLGVPAPIPMLGALLTFLLVVLGGPRVDGYPFR